ncbi:hypothetical protein EON65_55015, partial [archaeon]
MSPIYVQVYCEKQLRSRADRGMGPQALREQQAQKTQQQAQHLQSIQQQQMQEQQQQRQQKGGEGDAHSRLEYGGDAPP